MTIFGITVSWTTVAIVLGSIAAVVAIRFAARAIARRVRRATRTVTDIGALFNAAREAAVNETQDETKPRSLSGGDSLFLSRITKDFPDFSVTAAKEEIRSYMKERFADADSFRIHGVAICDYKRSGSEKTVVFQCAFELREDGRLRQRRWRLHYTNRTVDGGEYASQTCQSCGAAIRPGATECAYCGSRLVMTRAAWEITDAAEG